MEETGIFHVTLSRLNRCSGLLSQKRSIRGVRRGDARHISSFCVVAATSEVRSGKVVDVAFKRGTLGTARRQVLGEPDQPVGEFQRSTRGIVPVHVFVVTRNQRENVTRCGFFWTAAHHWTMPT